MQRDEMRGLARDRLMAYRKDSEIVTQWEIETSELAGKSGNLGIHGGKTSDPTAQVATKRLVPPSYIEEKRGWVSAINDAWAELLAEDTQDKITGSGKAYVLEEYYGLIKPPISNYAEKVDAICDKCAISKTTLSTWLRSGVEAVVVQAVRKQLV